MSFEELILKFSKRIKQLADKAFIQSSVIDKDDLYQEMIYNLWERWRNGELEDKTDAYIMGSCYFHLKNYLSPEFQVYKPRHDNGPVYIAFTWGSMFIEFSKIVWNMHMEQIVTELLKELF